MVGASAALIISEIPFVNPVGGVRVGRVNGQLVVNPTVEQRAESDIDLLVAGTSDALVMVECGAKEVLEADMVKALAFGQEQIKVLVKLQKDLQAKVGKPKVAAVKAERNEALSKEVQTAFAEKLFAALTMKVKIDSYKTIDGLKKEAIAQFCTDKPELKKDTVACFDELKETLWTAASSTRSAPSISRSASSPPPTAAASSPAARPRPWSPPPWAPSTTPRSSMAWKRSTARSSTCTTTSPATAWASASPTAGPAGARSATACWPSVPFSPCSRALKRTPTPCAWSRTSPKATARPPWPPSAAAPSP
jgi:3' exoribonuclease family, domain 2